jgi:vitamin B12 transporter
MKTHLKSVLTRAALPLAALALATPALAETIDIGEIVVTPNRTKTDKTKVGSTVETVSKEDIKQQSLPAVQDYLAQEPGVNIASQGGAGQETTLIVRGADKKYVKTLWNGIDLSDTSAPQVQVAPEHLLSNGIDSIEILKGSQSTLYGADAVAGVIGISTLGNFEEGIRYIVSGEAGSYGTFRGHLGTQAAAADGSRFAASVTGLTTDGISAADRRNGNTEADSYDNITVSLAGEKVLDANLTAFGSLLYIDTENEFDDGFSNPPVDNGNFGDRRQLAGRGGLTFRSDDGRTTNTASVQINDISRTLVFVSPLGDYIANYTSTRHRLDWLGEHQLSEQLTLQAGADYEGTSFTLTDNFGGNSTGSPWIAGGWVQAIWTPQENLTLTGAVRHDQHSNFGGFTTWRTTAAYLFDQTGTKLRGSAATGFRAPSPFELFADPDGPAFMGFGLAVANPNLQPEESFSWDVGVDQTLLDGALTVSATYFELDTDNLIDYVDNVGYVQAPGTAKRNGVETSLRWAVTDWADVTASYTFTRSIEADGDRRARVPKHDIVLGLFTRPADKWNTATTVRIVKDTVDIVRGNLVPLDDYVLVNAKVGYEPIDGLEVYIRGENLLDEQYQVVSGYGTPGASVYGGFSMQW